MKHISVFVLLGMLSLSVFAYCETFLFASRKSCLLPRKVLKVVDAADTVVAYRIDAMKAPADAEESLYGFALAGPPMVVAPQESDVLRALIDSFAVSSQQGEVRKLSTFIPDAGLKFRTSGDSVVVLLDWHAGMWMFFHKKKKYQMDNDSINGALQRVLKGVFGHPATRVPAVPDSASALDALAGEEGHKMTLTNELLPVEPPLKKKEETAAAGGPEYVRLSDDVLRLLKEAKSMTCYLLDPLGEAEAAAEKLGKYLILQERTEGRADVLKQFCQQVGGEKSFERLDVVKNCTFLPDVAFCVGDKQQTLTVFFSFYCSECEIWLDGKRVLRNDGSLIHTQMIDIARRIFPKDRYLRTIK